ncbi:hypothetical protein PanWU01x14_169050, partial [Parasponia andersonii]
KEKSLRRNLLELYKRNDLHWRQKSRINWVKDGDRCTKFFFLTTTVCSRTNSIECFKATDGSWLNNRDHIANAFLKYFCNVYSDGDIQDLSQLPNLLPISLSDVER